MGIPATDLTGQTFGRLVVLRRALERSSRVHWHCRCVCGAERTVRADNLTRGITVSCGCFHREDVARYATTHGQTRNGERHPLYLTWQSMNYRCTNPMAVKWDRYGGRGIRVCDRWRGTAGFQNFVADMGERPEGHTLDRIDPDDDYEPSNCRWATHHEQRVNRSAAARGATPPPPPRS